jgi:hypothetical protein
MTQEQELFERSWFLSRTDRHVQSHSGWITYSPPEVTHCLRIG